MVSHTTEPAASPPRRQARDITDAVVANMRQNLERLRYSTLAPSRYNVYLHPREYTRLEGILPILQHQTIRALAEDLDRLNARSPLRRLVHRFVGDSEPEIRTAAADWQADYIP